MNNTTSAMPVQHRSFGDRVRLVLARGRQAAFFGFAPGVFFGWLILACIVIPIAVVLIGALLVLVAMGITGSWVGLDVLGMMLLAVATWSLPALPVYAVVLWINDMTIYSFNPQLSRDPRVRHGQ